MPMASPRCLFRIFGMSCLRGESGFLSYRGECHGLQMPVAGSGTSLPTFSVLCDTKLSLSHRDPKHGQPGAGESKCVQIGEGTKFTWVLIKHQLLMPLRRNASVKACPVPYQEQAER